MVLILGTVFEQHSVQLLDVILGRSDGSKALEIISIASAIASPFFLVAGWQTIWYAARKVAFPPPPSVSLCPRYGWTSPRSQSWQSAGGSQLLRGSVSMTFQRPLELIDFGDEFENFGVIVMFLILCMGDIHFNHSYPFPTQRQGKSNFTHLQPFHIRWAGPRQRVS